ncbi:hypothetical protein [Hoyosella subflava]|uniref:Lipoprotein n=1 Tax=Hoyosella subflava (strain DSM 45089 / JCM 17490 / NBRC 109087 / DQS3-9A1) TaxID=443218 RepID=F6EGG8_HOYSD|nr:hypothetical protein [Hoyosella subflava]AEF41021.1 hypothetical protein AS9A_2574 [Hoyosella subflava DQS3-9A1]
MPRTPKRQFALALTCAGALVACGAPQDPDPSPVTTPPARTTEIPLPTPAEFDETEPGEPALDEVIFEGDYPIDVGPAGMVTVTVQNGSDAAVTLSDIQLEPGWRQENLEEDRDELELELVSDDGSIDIDVTVNNRRFDTDVSIDIPAQNGEFMFRLGGAGTITVEVDDDAVRVQNLDVRDDWEVRGEDRGRDRTVDIELTNPETRQAVEFEAEADDDRLDVQLNTRTRSVRITHE